MTKHLVAAAAIGALTLLNYIQFPGHTYLQADTQIYIPIVEHLWDPSVLADDLLVQKPHVAFTLYDELALALRKLTGLPFRDILAGEQIVCRALGIWGLFLIVSSAGLSAAASLLVASIVSLGATISGPSVLSFEYEPTPRGLALPLIFLAAGQVAHGRYLSGALAGAAAFLLHAPTTYPFWAVYPALALWPVETRRRKLYGLGILLGAVALLWIASRAQAGGAQAQTFFARLTPEQESLQRMRASYNWISIWAPVWLRHYLFLYGVTLLGVVRLRKTLTPDMRSFAIGLPLIGILSVPVSYLMLEKMKLGVTPQFQPMRAVLFITVMTTLLAGIAACVAVKESKYWEAIPWLALAYLIPANNRVLELPQTNRISVVLGMAGLSAAALWADRTKRAWAPLAVTAAAVTAFFVIPIYGKVTNYPALHSTELMQLSQWGRSSTPKSAVFLFPDAKQELYPGVFRAEALRTVYVDWKSGGQVNYFKDFGEQWLSRWQDVMLKPFETAVWARYVELGIDFVVLKREHKVVGRTPIFQNSRFVVYATK
jgi:hypothetical protein